MVANERPVVCSPLSAVHSASKKMRLVIDLRHVNECLWKQKFKYEDMALQLMKSGDYMVCFDLKSGYHYIDVHPSHHWTYLGFSWKYEDKERYLVFKVLQFGLATACYALQSCYDP